MCVYVTWDVVVHTRKKGSTENLCELRTLPRMHLLIPPANTLLGNIIICVLRVRWED